MVLRIRNSKKILEWTDVAELGPKFGGVISESKNNFKIYNCKEKSKNLPH